MLGDKLGLFDGPNVGLRDGETVGAAVLGDWLGLTDGPDVGLIDGEIVGADVLGDWLGLFDGPDVGELDGAELGLVVGDCVYSIKSPAPSSIDTTSVVSPMLATSATTLLFPSKSETVASVKRSVQQSKRFQTTTRLILTREFIFTIHHGSSEFSVCAIYRQKDLSSIVPVFPSLA